MAGTAMTLELLSVDDGHVVARRRRRPRPATLATGDRIGAWRVESELGRGGMAAVYAVSHAGFGKRAALKLAHRSAIGPEFTPATFLREARIVHLVNHPGVPDVFATGTYDGRPYLAMERLSGATLGQLYDRNALPRTDAIGILIELCQVLGVAHAAGVVHRDLKLDNVFVESSPGAGGRRVRLLDWGVARIEGEEDPLHGMIAGTLTYVAPEQLKGDDISPASDIYSLGVLAYTLLLGGPPFSAGNDLDLIRKHIHEPPPAPASRWPEIPRGLAALLGAMLAKDPLHRPGLDAIVGALEATRGPIAAPKPVLAFATPARPPLGFLAAPLAFGRRYRVLGATVAAVVAIASVLSMLGG